MFHGCFICHPFSFPFHLFPVKDTDIHVDSKPRSNLFGAIFQLCSTAFLSISDRVIQLFEDITDSLSEATDSGSHNY